MGVSEKILLRGESPWGDIVEQFPDGTAKLKIDNDLIDDWTQEERDAFAERTGTPKSWVISPVHNHGYHYGDIVHCRKHPEYNKWIPLADWRDDY